MSFNSIFVSIRRIRFFGRIQFTLAVVVILGITSLAVGVKSWHHNANRVVSIQSEPKSPQNTQGQKMEAVVLNVTPRGFEPSEIKRTSGPFFFVIRPGDGIQDLDLTLDREGGNRMYAYKENLIKGSRKQRQVIDLKPGNYVLRESAHPDLVCRIKITEN